MVIVIIMVIIIIIMVIIVILIVIMFNIIIVIIMVILIITVILIVWSVITTTSLITFTNLSSIIYITLSTRHLPTARHGRAHVRPPALHAHKIRGLPRGVHPETGEGEAGRIGRPLHGTGLHRQAGVREGSAGKTAGCQEFRR